MAKQKDPLELMREQVVEQELSARSWKAFYDKMYFTLECEKIKDQYETVVEEQRAKLTKQMEASLKQAEAIDEQTKKED